MQTAGLSSTRTFLEHMLNFIVYNKYLESITLTTTLVLRAILHEVYLSFMNSGSSSKEIKYSYQIFSKSGLGLYFTDHITMKNIISEFFSTNHYTIRSKWVVENSRFAGVGAEVIQRSNLFFENCKNRSS